MAAEVASSWPRCRRDWSWTRRWVAGATPGRSSPPAPTSASSASTGIPPPWQRRARRSSPSGTGSASCRAASRHVAEIVASADIVGNEGIVAILFDLGVSSPQLDRPVRGFSYWADAAPLDMRMDSVQTLTAATVVERVLRGRPRRAHRPQR